MKITELPRLNTVRRDAEIPLAVEGENYNMALEQILDASSSAPVRFFVVRGRPANVKMGSGVPNVAIGNVIYDTQDDRFYLAVSAHSDIEGPTETRWTYYSEWSTYDSFYDERGKIRTDCLFQSMDGRLYFSPTGQNIKSAGITEIQAIQIRNATPIEVASEEEMQQRIASGEYEEGQIYFLAES